MEQKKLLEEESKRDVSTDSDHTDVYELLTRKDREFEDFRASMLAEIDALRNDISLIAPLEQTENEALRMRVIDLESELSACRENTRRMDEALAGCVSVDDVSRMAKEISTEHSVRDSTPQDSLDKLCFEDDRSLEVAIEDVISSLVMPRLTQLAEDRFVELSAISDQVTLFLTTHEEKKEELLKLSSAENKKKTQQNCLSERAVEEMVSSVVSRECSALNLDELEIKNLMQSTHSEKLRVTLPPDHAQRGAGGEIVYSLTSPTFSRKEELIDQIGRPDASNVRVAAAYVWDLMAQLFNVEDGIGKPEDAISHEVALGQCWAMTVR